MPRIILLCGPAGSGKSSYCKIYISNNWIRISQDDDGKQHLEIFKEAIAKKQCVIIDRMNFNKIQRDRYLTPAKEAGYETEIMVLHVPRSVCLERCLARKDHPTIKCEQDAQNALNTFFGKYERVKDSEADKVTRLGWDNNESIIVCDLDNTLCLNEHREHFMRGEKKDWIGFFNAMDKDTLNKPLHTVLTSLYPTPIYYASGRPDTYRAITETWLEQNTRIPHEGLFMRPRNDSRADNITKEVILDFELLTRGKPYIIFDDRNSVVRLWRDRGFTCFQVNDGNF